MTARVTLTQTLHQLGELVVALLLGSPAIHRTGRTAGALMILAVGAVVTATSSPGLLSVRAVLRPSGQRLADLALAVACLAVVIAVTRTDVVATGPLVLASMLLVRVARLPAPAAAGRPAVIEPVPTRASPPPLLNRLARAAGVFVRSQRRDRA